MRALPDTMDCPVSGQTSPRDTEGPLEPLAEYQLKTSDGRRGEHQACWGVALSTDGSQIWRKIWVGPERWNAHLEGWQPEGVIWPSWPARPSDEALSSESALNGVQDYWAKTGDRLRESAKWMASVIGAALAALIGTSPLALVNSEHLGPVSFMLGAIGLLSLGITLFLVMQVMRPKAVSFTDIQSAWGGALGRWQDRVESHEDIYLPCGVKCLTSLRQSMIIEKMTLIALALAHENPAGQRMCGELAEAQAARAARLVELRSAAVSITTIGEYYALRSRSTWATYGGILSGLIGTAATIAAFAWPPA